MYSFAAWGEGISMKYKAVKEILQWSLTVFLSVSAVAAVSIFMNGMYLLGIPDPEDVQGVVAEYPGIPDEKKGIHGSGDRMVEGKTAGHKTNSLTPLSGPVKLIFRIMNRGDSV